MTIQEFLLEKLGDEIFFKTPQKEKQFLYSLMEGWAKEVLSNQQTSEIKSDEVDIKKID